MTPDQIFAAQRIGASILESIEEAGKLGAPSGVLYAALQTAGCTLNQYQSILATMTNRGFVVDDEHCLTITSLGKAFLKSLKDVIAKKEKTCHM